MITEPFLLVVCDALVAAAQESTDGQHYLAVAYAAAFVEGQLAALPWLLRIGQRLAFALFRLHVRLTRFAGFSDLDQPDRIAAVEQWAGGPIPQGRQFFRAIRNLTLLAYYEAREGVPVPPRAPSTTVRASAIVPRPSPPPDERAGVLVIGTGAGGAVTALELARHGHDVLMVEEGRLIEGDPPDAGSTETMAHLYRHRGMTPMMGRVPIAYVEGQCVGGSTEINSGFWHRPPHETLLRWQSQYELTEAGPDQLRPHWEWAEAMLGVGRHDGPLPPSSEIFARGAEALGWAYHEVPRTAAQARVSPAAAPPDAGPGMSRSLIPKAVSTGARLLTGCRVDRLETNGTRIVAATITRTDEGGTTRQIRVRADHVFVCAGPTETPSLLRRSGIVNNVGDSLRVHPMLKVAARFKNCHAGTLGGMPLVQVTQFGPDLVLGGSYFTPGHLAMVLSDNWMLTHDRMPDIDRMACYYVGVRGTGRGRVRPSLLEAGRTEMRYELSDKDIWNLSNGVARLATLLLEGGATEVLPAVRDVPAIRSKLEAVRWLDEPLDRRACSLTTVHAFSSCPLGERRDRCAADSFGKLHGFDNVYVNDASMVPDSPGVNPQGTIMSLARRNALRFCDEHTA